MLSDKKVHIHLSIINRHSVASCIHRGRLKQWAWLAALLITFPLLSFLPRPSTSPPTIYYLDIPIYDNNPDIPMYDNDSTKHRNSSRDSSVSSWVPTLASVYAGTFSYQLLLPFIVVICTCCIFRACFLIVLRRAPSWLPCHSPIPPPHKPWHGRLGGKLQG